jgi:hypothetical protein
MYNALLARHKTLQEELHGLYKAKVSTVQDQRDKLNSMRKVYEKITSDSDKALSMNFEKVTDVTTFDQLSTEFILFYQKIQKESKKSTEKPLPDLTPETDETMELRVPEKFQAKLLENIAAMGKISDGYASPANSQLEGEGLTVCVHKTRDEPMIGNFIIKAHDKEGHAKKRGGDEIKVILKSSEKGVGKLGRLASRDSEDSHFVANIVDSNDGVYAVNYTVNSADLSGEQEMTVLMNGEHVVGSPFRVMFVRKYQRSSGSAPLSGSGSAPSWERERAERGLGESKSEKDIMTRGERESRERERQIREEASSPSSRPESLNNIRQELVLASNNHHHHNSGNEARGNAVNRLVSGSNMEILGNGMKATASLNVAYCKLQYPLNDMNSKINLRRTKGGNPDIGYCDVAIFDSPNIPSTFGANGHISGSKVFWRIWNGEFYYNGKLVSTNIHGQYQGQTGDCKISVQYNGTKMILFFNDMIVHSFNVPSGETYYLYLRPYYQNSTIELLP